MPMSTDVVLPATHTVVWPRECPGCGAPDPGNLLRVSHRRTSLAALWWPILHFFGKRHACEVPICHPCRSRSLRSRWWRFTSGIVIVIAVLTLVDPWLRNAIATRGLRRLAFLGIAFLALSPLIALYVFAPPAVDITVGKHTITYEFARPGYATAFAKANGLER